MTVSDDTQVALSAKRVAERLAAGEIQVVDVREPYEWEAGHIAGARHIELERLPAEADAIDREVPVVFTCRGGSRSAMAAEAFRNAGYEAYNMDGGLVAWAEDDLPIDPPEGEVAERRI